MNEKESEAINEELAKLAEMQKNIALLESIAKQKMTKQAISRYGNLKLAHPEIAVKAIALIAQAVQSGQIKEEITDEAFKGLLKELQEGKKEFKIKKL